MKKIVSIFAVAILAVAAQATQVTWGTGLMYQAKNADGDWVATSGASGKVAQNSASVIIYLVSEAVFSDAIADSAEDIYKASGDGKISYLSKNEAKSNAGGVVSWKDTANDYVKDDKAYAIFVTTYTDPTYGEFYSVNFGAMKIGDSGVSALNVGGTNYQNSNIVNSGHQWTPVPTDPVPEPCTVALLALGLAAAGLKRKVA